MTKEADILDVDADFDSSSLSSFSESDWGELDEPCVQVNGQRINLTPGKGHVIIGGHESVQIIDGGIAVYGATTSGSFQSSPFSSSSSSSRHHKRQLTDSTHPPSKADLDFICDNIGRRWKSLGRALGLSRGALEQVELDFRSEGQYEMAWQLLLKWRRQHGDAARTCDLAHALDKIDMGQLARALPVV